MATGRRQWNDPKTQALLGRAELQLAQSESTLSKLELQRDSDRPSLESIEGQLEELSRVVRDKEPTLPDIRVVLEKPSSDPPKFSLRSPLGNISARGRYAVTAAVLVVTAWAAAKILPWTTAPNRPSTSTQTPSMPAQGAR